MKEQVQAFVTLMTQKGYRGRFSVVPDFQSQRLVRESSLESCLSTWLKVDFTPSGPGRDLYLAYPFYSSLHQQQAECLFELGFSDGKGISISQMRVELQARREEKTFRFRNNQELPGFNSIEGHFNRQMPWDDLLKGRMPRR